MSASPAEPALCYGRKYVVQGVIWRERDFLQGRACTLMFERVPTKRHTRIPWSIRRDDERNQQSRHSLVEQQACFRQAARRAQDALTSSATDRRRHRENATTAVVADIVASIRARLGKQLGGRARLDGCLTPWLMLARWPLPPENCPSASELLRHQLVRVVGLLAALRLLPVGELHLPVRQLLVRDVRKKRRSLVIRQAWSVSSEGALCYRVAAVVNASQCARAITVASLIPVKRDF